MSLHFDPPFQVQLTLNGFVHPQWKDWYLDMSNLIQKGFSGTIVTAKLTGGGANGSMTFLNGVLTSSTAAT